MSHRAFVYYLVLALASALAAGFILGTLVGRALAGPARGPVTASWYGPGLYGNRMACGGRLRPGTVGVAHRTLPCGRRLRIIRHGRVARVRVIDRGPYNYSRTFDLTGPVKRRLRCGDLCRVYWRYGWGR